MRIFRRGVSLDQQKSATVEKRLRKLLQPEHYNNTIVCLEPEKETGRHPATAETVLSAAEGCGVMDKTDGKPLAEKLREMERNGASVLVIDALDDEPYVTSSIAVVRWKQKAFLLAADCLRRAFGFEQILLAVYSRGVYAGLRLPSGCGITIKKLRCRYPARIRLQDMYGSRPERFGVIGAESLLHLYRALYNAKMQDSVIVTVAGTAVGSPCNVEVTVGTPVSALLDLCGLTCPPAVLVRGGAMTGRAMTDTSEPVAEDDTAFLAFADPIRKRQYACVGCGRCSRVCPCDLMPEALYKNASAGVFAACGYLKVDKCIECGCCSYICPSNIDLVSYIRRAKDRLYGPKQSGQDTQTAAEGTPGEKSAPDEGLEAILRRQSLTAEEDPEEKYDSPVPDVRDKRRRPGKARMTGSSGPSAPDAPPNEPATQEAAFSGETPQENVPAGSVPASGAPTAENRGGEAPASAAIEEV